MYNIIYVTDAVECVSGVECSEHDITVTRAWEIHVDGANNRSTSAMRKNVIAQTQKYLRR